MSKIYLVLLITVNNIKKYKGKHMKLKHFFYSTPLIKEFIILFSSISSETQNFSYILSKKDICNDKAINNALLNLWSDRKFLELATIFKEKPSLFIKSQRTIIFNHLMHFIFSSREDFNLKHKISDKELFQFTLIVDSHPEIQKDFRNFLADSFLKIDILNYFSPYILLANQNLAIFEPFSDLRFNKKELFNDFNKTISSFLNSIDNKDFYHINNENKVSVKFQPNTPFFSDEKLINFKSYVAIKTFSHAIENNIQKFSLTLPVPILISLAYLINKEAKDPNFKITNTIIKKCFVANNIYYNKILKRATYNKEIFNDKIGQEFIDWHLIQSQNLANQNTNSPNQETTQSYIQILKKLKNENKYDKNNKLSNQEVIYHYLNEINNIEITKNVSAIISATQNLKDKVQSNSEIISYLNNLDMTIISILENYISYSSLSQDEYTLEDMLKKPLNNIKLSVTSLLKKEQEQNISDFIKSTNKINKIL